jgi:hypothetical protein
MSERETRVYRVEADYEGWTWTRRYFSKQAAQKQVERRRAGWTYEATTWEDEDIVQDPALRVRLIESDPITWPRPMDGQDGTEDTRAEDGEG